MKVVRKDLEAGVQLPTGTYLKEFHSLHDPWPVPAVRF
jgi:carboxylesterase